jgi:tetratricopeptide (TPR) repeat protein
MVVDLIANNDWSRPIYFSVTVGNRAKSFFWLQEYFELEGLAYRFVPIKYGPAPSQTADFGQVDTETMYDNLMNKFAYGNMEKPGVYLDETNRRLSYNLRNSFGRLANQLIDEGQNEKAIKALDRAMELMPEEKFEFNYFVNGILEGYYKAGATESAEAIATLFQTRLVEQLEYYKSFSRKERKFVEQEIRTALSYLQLLAQLEQRFKYANNPSEFSQSEVFQAFNRYATEFPVGR